MTTWVPSISRWITWKRALFISAALIVVFITLFIYDFYPFDDLKGKFGHYLGHDFAQFYAQSQVLASVQPEELYDPTVQQRILQKILGASSIDFSLPFVYPPFLLTLIVWMRNCRYVTAYAIWMMLSAFIFGITIRLLLRELDSLPQVVKGRSIFVILLAWPIYLVETLLNGHVSVLGCFLFTAVYILMKKSRWIWAGFVLGLLAYKPSLFLLPCIFLLLYRPQIWKGLAFSLLVLAVLSIYMVGFEGITSFFSAITSQNMIWMGQGTVYERPLHKYYSLSAFISLLPGGGTLFGKVFVIVFGFIGFGFALSWISEAKDAPVMGRTFDLQYVFMWLVGGVLSPYFPLYDWLFLGPALLMVANSLCALPAVWDKEGDRFLVWCLLLYVTSVMSQLISVHCGIQIFVPVMLGFIAYLHSLSRQPSI